MDMTSNRKLLLTLLLLLLTTSLFEGIIIKSLATCQGPSRRKHITFVMTLTGVPSGLFCYRWAEPCFFWRSLFCVDNIITIYLFWFQNFIYMGILRVVPWVEGVFSTVSWRNWFVPQSLLCAWLILPVFNY